MVPIESRDFSGVYRLVFDDGAFYIGCAEHLRKRYYHWGSAFRTRSKLSANVLEKILVSRVVKMEVVELCSKVDLKRREAFYLDKHKADHLLLSRSEYAWSPVLQYDANGVFVKRHPSIGEAARHNSFKLSKVQMVLSGQRSAHKGMVFMYEGENETALFKKRDTPKKNKSIKINQCDPDGNVVATYVTLTEAEKKVGCSRRNIQRVLSGEQKTAAGFAWEYAS